MQRVKLGIGALFVIVIVILIVIKRLADDNYSETLSVIQDIQNSLEKYRIDCGGYPMTDVGLEALVLKSNANCNSVREEGYLNGLQFVPDDIWGNKLIYESDGINYSIRSSGDKWIFGDNKNEAKVYEK